MKTKPEIDWNVDLPLCVWFYRPLAQSIERGPVKICVSCGFNYDHVEGVSRHRVEFYAK